MDQLRRADLLLTELTERRVRLHQALDHTLTLHVKLRQQHRELIRIIRESEVTVASVRVETAHVPS